MAVDGAAIAPDDLIELGRIISAYGVRGWVKIQPHSAQGTVLRAAPVWWLAAPVAPQAKPAALVAHKVKQVRPQGATIVADLEGVGERDLAESLRSLSQDCIFPKRKPMNFIGSILSVARCLAKRVYWVLSTKSLTTVRMLYLKCTDSKSKPLVYRLLCLMQKVSPKKCSCLSSRHTCST
jgi:RimM N-terminal domain